LINNGTVKHSGQRLVNNAEHATSVFGQTDLNREVAIAVDEAGGAVERIDHPHALLVETVRSVDRLFSEDAIAGKLPAQTRHDDFIRERVGLGDGLAIVCAKLLLDV